MSNILVDVVSFGARGDGITDDTKAFEDALELLRNVGGGTLIVNSNKAYLIRPIHIQNNHLVFWLQHNVTLLGIRDAFQWPLTTPIPSYGIGTDFTPDPQKPNLFRHVALLYGTRVTNVTFRGEGYDSVIDGNGDYWWKRFKETNRTRVSHNVTRPCLLEFQYSKHVRFFNLRLRNSPYWNWHMFDSDHLTVHNMWIEATENSPNTDGWNPSSCRHVTIEDSSYVGGDDCIALKSGFDCFGVWYNTPSEYIHVRNVTCQGDVAASIALGSELSGGIRHVLIEQIRFPQKVKKPITIKSGTSRGGWVHNVTFRDFEITGTLQHPAIHLDMLEYSPGETCIFRNCRNSACPAGWMPTFSPPRITNITIVGMNGLAANMHEWQGEAFHFAALTNHQSKGALMANLTLQDIYFPPSATWSCKGPIHGRSYNVFPASSCFDNGEILSKDIDNTVYTLAESGNDILTVALLSMMILLAFAFVQIPRKMQVYRTACAVSSSTRRNNDMMNGR